jgi:hypothetical protein
MLHGNLMGIALLNLRGPTHPTSWRALRNL